MSPLNEPLLKILETQISPTKNEGRKIIARNVINEWLCYCYCYCSYFPRRALYSYYTVFVRLSYSIYQRLNRVNRHQSNTRYFMTL